MKKILPTITALIVLAAGCAGTSSNSRLPEEFISSVQNSPELLDVDASLDELDEKTAQLSAQYEELQQGILPHTSFDSDTSVNANEIAVYINENNVLSVNGRTMSKNDFTVFADKALPGLCTPTPTILIHKKADYDMAAWVLDSFYQHGCVNVSIE